MHTGIALTDAAKELARCDRLDERERRVELEERHVAYDASLNTIRNAAAALLQRINAIGKEMGDKISARDELDAEVRTLSGERKELRVEWRKLMVDLQEKQGYE